MIKTILFFMLISISMFAQSYNKYEGYIKKPSGIDVRNPKEDEFIENRVHRVGLFWMNITNMGVFGNPASWVLYFEDPCTGRQAVGGDMPGGEDKQYLYDGALWFGGYLDSAEVNVNGTNATIFQGPLVSTGSVYYGYHTFELLPFLFDEDESGATLGRINETSNIEGRINCLFEDVYDPAASAEEQFNTMYTDKYPYYSNDVYDGRYHVPLGIEVRQRTYSWSYKFAEKFIILDYTLYNRNEDQKDIYDFFMGVNIDPDIGRKDGHDYYVDDICGFINEWEDYIDPATGENRTVDLNFAWSADNDGRELEQVTVGGGMVPTFREPLRGSPLDGATGVFTMRVLRNPNPNLRYSFNIYSGAVWDESYDWSPRWKVGEHSDWGFDLTTKQKGYDDVNYDSLYSSYNGEFVANGITEGTPYGDKGRYMVMSNFEYDYAITDTREVYLGVFEDPPSLIGTPFAQADKWQPWIISGTEQEGEYPDGTIEDLNDMANGGDIKYILSFGPLGEESYVNVGIDLNHDGSIDDFVNKQVWKFAYGDSIKLTLAFTASEDFHISVSQTAKYNSPYVVDLNQGVNTSLFNWYDAYYNVVWAERVYDQPMYDTPITRNGETKTDGWYGEDVGADGIFTDPVVNPICWWNNSFYEGPDEGEIDFELTTFTNEFIDPYGRTATSEDDLLPFGREEVDSENKYGITGSRDTGEGFGRMVRYHQSDGVANRGEYVRFGYNNGKLDPGDGVPDYQVPPPPVSPKINVSYADKDVIVEWCSHEFYEVQGIKGAAGPEHSIDTFSRRRDFEGYQIQVAPRNEKDEYAEIFTVDKINYVYENVVEYEEYLNIPISEDSILANPDDYPPLLTYAGKVWQLIPFKENISYRENHSKDGVYTFTATQDSIELASGDSTRTVVFYNYKFVLHNKLYGKENYISVTASDHGDPVTETPSMKSDPRINAVSIIPSKLTYKTDVVVFPNPYRDDVDYQALGWENLDGDTWYEQDRRIMFMNLPKRCVLKIYTLAGDLVKTIAHNGNAATDTPYQQGENGAYWNFISENNQAAVSGIYLFSVQDVDSNFEFVGKFVIIK
ncbi:MAG: hypothetical protein GQ534_01445 [Candidatus Delongbacteria bacterium]|nr:hypothetical protein [Candidatus Delongbacteria bacterium]